MEERGGLMAPKKHEKKADYEVKDTRPAEEGAKIVEETQREKDVRLEDREGGDRQSLQAKEIREGEEPGQALDFTERRRAGDRE
jgi:hypothetical protein